jgi:hypothetical protein
MIKARYIIGLIFGIETGRIALEDHDLAKPPLPIFKLSENCPYYVTSYETPRLSYSAHNNKNTANNPTMPTFITVQSFGSLCSTSKQTTPFENHSIRFVTINPPADPALKPDQIKNCLVTMVDDFMRDNAVLLTHNDCRISEFECTDSSTEIPLGESLMLVCGVTVAREDHLTQTCWVFDTSGRKIREYNGRLSKILPYDAHSQLKTTPEERAEWTAVYFDKSDMPSLDTP